MNTVRDVERTVPQWGQERRAVVEGVMSESEGVTFSPFASRIRRTRKDNEASYII